MFHTVHPGRALPALLTLLVLAVTGCAGDIPSAVTPVIPVPDAASATEDSQPGTDLQLCEQELAAMQKLAPEKHRARQAEFDRVMRAASGYSGVRDTVGQEARLTADAFYEYKTSVVCAQIKQDTLEALVTLPGA